MPFAGSGLLRPPVKWASVREDGSMEFSPFSYRCDISSANYIKVFALSVVLLPLRVVLVGTSFILALATASLITVGYGSTTSLKPDESYRRRVLLPLFILLARTVFFAAGFHYVSVKGKRASRQDAPILVLGPHSSFIDSLVVLALACDMEIPSVVATTGHANSPIGPLLKVLQPILVNRADKLSRQKTVQDICERARSPKSWPQLVVFPEGTCTNRHFLLTFRQGAFAPGVPVQPVLVRWPNKLDCITWVWDGLTVKKILWLTLSQFHTRCEVEFLPVYKPNEEEKADPQLYAENVRRTMADALQVPTCDYVYEDFCRMQLANECGLPVPEAMTLLYSLLRIIFKKPSPSPDHLCDNNDPIHHRMEELLAKARRAPRMSPIDFIDSLFPHLRLSRRETGLLDKVLRQYKQPTGLVNFRAFVLHTCMLLYGSRPREALRIAVQAFNPVEYLPLGVFEIRSRKLSPKANRQWVISSADITELLSTIFAPSSGDLAREIIDGLAASSRPRSSMLFDSDTRSPTASSDQLFDALSKQRPETLMCYARYDEKLEKRSQPLKQRIYSDFESKIGSVTSISFETSAIPTPSAHSADSTNKSDFSNSNSSVQRLEAEELTPVFRSRSRVRYLGLMNETCSAAHRRSLPTPVANEVGNALR
ncbi:unnamed protein product [Calicophoron daubneyi]|uniref:Phospholipid/glycerol acyltransferase domain-containing protein n=1 Tax=Calicophoron daubneyi TaxID=300641 RepID=A0AAV2TMN8_CALDB